MPYVMASMLKPPMGTFCALPLAEGEDGFLNAEAKACVPKLQSRCTFTGANPAFAAAKGGEGSVAQRQHALERAHGLAPRPRGASRGDLSSTGTKTCTFGDLVLVHKL